MNVWTKIQVLLLSAVLILAVAIAQEKKPELPAISDKAARNIRELELRSAQITIELQRLAAQYTQLQAQQSQVNTQIAEASAAAVKEAKLDPEKYRLDDNLKIVEVPKKP